MKRSILVDLSVTVEIEVDTDKLAAHAPDALTRGYQDPTWTKDFYPFTTEDEVFEHFAYNAVMNGVRYPTKQLDGWADLDELPYDQIPITTDVQGVHFQGLSEATVD